MTVKPPLPPFTWESAVQKIQAAEDAWNRQDPEQVALAYSVDSRWRNRDSFVKGRDEIIAFLRSKWSRELDYHLVKELWAYGGNRIAVRYCYESHDPDGQWWRSFGNENWEFDASGLMCARHSSINDVPIEEAERKLRWEAGQPRPKGHAGLTELGF